MFNNIIFRHIIPKLIENLSKVGKIWKVNWIKSEEPPLE